MGSKLRGFALGVSMSMKVLVPAFASRLVGGVEVFRVSTHCVWDCRIESAGLQFVKSWLGQLSMFVVLSLRQL